MELVDPDKHDELNEIDVWTEYTKADEFGVTETARSKVRDMNWVCPCPEGILPKTVDSDFQKEDEKAEIRNDAETVAWLDPNIKPSTRMRMLPEAAPEFAPLPFATETGVVNNDWLSKQPCPKVAVTVARFAEIDPREALSRTVLDEIQIDISDDDCNNLDDMLVSRPGKFWPISVIKLDPVSAHAPAIVVDVGTSNKIKAAELVRWMPTLALIYDDP